MLSSLSPSVQDPVPWMVLPTCDFLLQLPTLYFFIDVHRGLFPGWCWTILTINPELWGRFLFLPWEYVPSYSVCTLKDNQSDAGPGIVYSAILILSLRRSAPSFPKTTLVPVFTALGTHASRSWIAALLQLVASSPMSSSCPWQGHGARHMAKSLVVPSFL